MTFRCLNLQVSTGVALRATPARASIWGSTPKFKVLVKKSTPAEPSNGPLFCMPLQISLLNLYSWRPSTPPSKTWVPPFLFFFPLLPHLSLLSPLLLAGLLLDSRRPSFSVPRPPTSDTPWCRWWMGSYACVPQPPPTATTLGQSIAVRRCKLALETFRVNGDITALGGLRQEARHDSEQFELCWCRQQSQRFQTSFFESKFPNCS
jgi:hypothetical protein